MNRFYALMERWFKNPEDLGTGFAIIAFIAVGVGNLVNLEFLTNFGFACLGAGIVAWGVNAIQRGEMTPLRRGFHVIEHIEGLLARAWGIVLILGGLALLGFGILSILNPRSPMPATLRQFFATPQGSALLLLFGSAVGVLFSLTMIFVSDAEANNRYVRFLKSIPGRLIGVLLLVFFGALAAVSLIQIFSPTAWENIFQTILQALGFL